MAFRPFFMPHSALLLDPPLSHSPCPKTSLSRAVDAPAPAPPCVACPPPSPATLPWASPPPTDRAACFFAAPFSAPRLPLLQPAARPPTLCGPPRVTAPPVETCADGPTLAASPLPHDLPPMTAVAAQEDGLAAYFRSSPALRQINRLIRSLAVRLSSSRVRLAVSFGMKRCATVRWWWACGPPPRHASDCPLTQHTKGQPSSKYTGCRAFK